MRNLFYLFWIFLFLNACDQSPDSIEVDGNGYPPLPVYSIKEPYPDDPLRIKVTVYDDQKNVLEQGEYYNSLREGAWTIFHPNGFPKEVVGYVHGQKHGFRISLDNRGQLLERSYYMNDKKNGLLVRYNRSRVKEEYTYSEDVLDGSVKKYYNTGNIMEESNYLNGKLEGIARWYDQEGNVAIEYQYKDGVWLNPEN